MGIGICCMAKTDTFDQIEVNSEMRAFSITPKSMGISPTDKFFLFPREESFNSGYSSDLGLSQGFNPSP